MVLPSFLISLGTTSLLLLRGVDRCPHIGATIALLRCLSVSSLPLQPLSRLGASGLTISHTATVLLLLHRKQKRAVLGKVQAQCFWFPRRVLRGHFGSFGRLRPWRSTERDVVHSSLWEINRFHHRFRCWFQGKFHRTTAFVTLINAGDKQLLIEPETMCMRNSCGYHYQPRRKFGHELNYQNETINTDPINTFQSFKQWNRILKIKK